MDFVTLILAVSPLIIVLICVLLMRLPADISGLAGFIVALLVAITYFNTDAAVAGKSVAAGIITSLPISLLVAASIFQALFMERAGAIRRIAVTLKTLTAGDKPAQMVIISLGIGSILAAVGINPLSILPLLLLGLGMPAYAAITLPAVGAGALWIYSFYAAPVESFFLHLGGGQTLDQAGAFLVRYLWPTTLIATLGLHYITGGAKSIARGIIPSILSATAVWLAAAYAAKLGATRYTGIIAGLAVVVIMLLWAMLRRIRVHDKTSLTAADEADGKGMPLIIALLPLILTAIFIFLANNAAPIRDFLNETASAPVRILPAQVIHIRPLWQPYFWVLAATLLCIPIYRGGMRSLRDASALWLSRAPRPIIAAVLFFATALVMWNSGKVEISGAPHFSALVLREGNLNMIRAMQDACAAFGRFYPFLGTISGIRMGFISGSATLPIEMLTRTHLEIAETLFKPGGAGTFIAAASALAASFMLMVNPARLQNASALIGRIGLESRVLWTTIITVFIMMISLATFTLILATR